MLDIKFIRENEEKVKKASQNKNIQVDIDRLLEVDRERKEVLQALEDMRAKKNKASRIISAAASEKEKRKNILEMQELDKNSDRLNEDLKNLEKEFKNLMFQIPNIPLGGVPIGEDERGNIIIKKVGDIPKFNFAPKEHFEIGEQLDIIDTERATKVAGSRFYYLKREGALLELALIKLGFDTLVKEGFIPIIPPVMIKSGMAIAMGYLQQTDDAEAYYLPKDDLYLVATSEQSLGAMHAGETFDEKDLPLRYVGFSTCFRREAGSYGKDKKGILRMHQFDKIEMFVFCKPEDSVKEHQYLLSIEEKLMQALKIPYQILNICTGDLGVPAAAKYDIEAWLPGQNKYRETHSTSNCTDFQARRLNIRYRGKNGKLNFVHTLNGTAFSMRPIIAILENFQQKDGSVKIPKVLQEYIGKSEIRR